MIKRILFFLFLILPFAALSAQTDRWIALSEQFDRQIDDGYYREALQTADEALALAQKDYGPEHPRRLMSLYFRAEALRYLSRFRESIDICSGFFPAAERVLGPGDLFFARILKTRGKLFMFQAMEQEGLGDLKRSWDIYQAKLGPEHPDTIKAKYHYIIAYGSLGNYDEAFKVLKEILAKQIDALGPDHPDVAFTYNAMGNILQEQALFEQSETYYLKAFEIQEKVLRADHPDKVTILNNLAYTSYKIGRNEEGEYYLRQVMALVEVSYGQDSLDYAYALGTLAFFLQAQGDYEEAEALNLDALAIIEKETGAVSIDMATGYNNLAQLYSEMNQPEKAEAMLFKSLAIREELQGPSHPDYLSTKIHLASFYLSFDKTDKTESLMREVIPVIDESLGPESPLLIYPLYVLGGLTLDKGQFAEAEPYLLRAVAIIEKSYGPEDEGLIILYQWLSVVYDNTDRPSESAAMLRRAKRLQWKSQNQ